MQHVCCSWLGRVSTDSSSMPTAAGAYIDVFNVGVSSFDTENDAKEEFSTMITSIRAACISDRNGSPGGAQLKTIEANLATNETEYTIQSRSGFATFPISCAMPSKQVCC